MNRSSVKLYGILFVAILAVSCAAILIRLCDAPSLVIAAYRLSFASLILAPAALPRLWNDLRDLKTEDLRLTFLSGGFLAFHFGAWIASLQYTSVASSVVLVTTNPIFVSLASPFVLGERVVPRMWGGIGISVVGGMLMGFGDWGTGKESLWGDGLALLGAVMMSAYLLAGRRLRQQLPLLSYVFPVYATAAVISIAFCLIFRYRFTGYAPETYLFFVLLAVVPQILGHSSINWSLGRLSPAFVSVILLGEPMGATLLALLFLHEVPSRLTLLGGGLILAGVYLSPKEGTMG